MSENMKRFNCGDVLRVPLSLVQIDGNPQEKYPFSRERADILYSSAFRNLSAKTQVFHSDFSANLRTRLTHTLEVARIAVDMAERLGFDTALTEAIALGHDLGHTPFGHVGERAIHRFSTGKDRKYVAKDGSQMEPTDELCGFKHNQQSVRLLVEYTPGCKFSNFVLYGIRGHSNLEYGNSEQYRKTGFYDRYEKNCSVVNDQTIIPAWSVEAFLVKWADEIAQRHHDIEDAYFQKIMTPKQIVTLLERFNNLTQEEDRHFYEEMREIGDNYENLDRMSRELFPWCLTNFVINVYVCNVVREFQKCVEDLVENKAITSNETFAQKYASISEKEIRHMFSLEDTAISEADSILNKELKYAILDSYEVQRMDGKSEYIVRRLLRAYKSNPQQLPNKYLNHLMQTELQNLISSREKKFLLDMVNEKLGYGTDSEEVQRWHDYQCRNALRILLDDVKAEKMILPALMRVVFDYIASMTDDSAYEEYKELYE